MSVAGASGTIESDLARVLLYRWVWGKLPASELQKLSYGAYKDELASLTRARVTDPEGYVNATIKRLASLGTWGKHPGNVHAELVAFLGEPELPAPFVVKVSQRVRKSRLWNGSIQKVPMHFMLPHILFHHVYTSSKSNFFSLFLGTTDNPIDRLESFWKLLLHLQQRKRRHLWCFFCNHDRRRTSCWRASRSLCLWQ